MEDKTLELIKTRRSVRSYEDKKVPEELLNKVDEKILTIDDFLDDFKFKD